MFDESKDKTVFEARNEETGLWFGLYSYNGGDPKVQIGPREVEKKDGSPMFVKAGRLTISEMDWVVVQYQTAQSETLKEAANG